MDRKPFQDHFLYPLTHDTVRTYAVPGARDTAMKDTTPLPEPSRLGHDRNTVRNALKLRDLQVLWNAEKGASSSAGAAFERRLCEKDFKRERR